MVKVGIIDADVPPAGELIRILVHHPEVELTTLYSASLPGRSVNTVHHGLIGEQSLNFSDKINTGNLDTLIILNKSTLSDTIISQIDNESDLKLIVYNPNIFDRIKEEEEVAVGLSEINRKTLVRGAKKAYLLSPLIVPALIALAPLAKYLLLNSDIDIMVNAPSDLEENADSAGLSEIIKENLKIIQSSFKGNIKLHWDPVVSTYPRCQATYISFNNSLPLEEIEKIYNDIYDDHNFTFISRRDITPKEVEGTQKTVIYLEKPDTDILKIKIVSDPRMRGGAGDAVHVLNLFFGLHEKTGLNLKASSY